MTVVGEDASRWRGVVCVAAALPSEGQICGFDVEGRRIAVAMVRGQLFAFDDQCTHRPSSLSLDGCVVGDVIECGWHRSQFDPETGEALALPARDALRVYDLTIVNGQVIAVEGPQS